MFSSLSRCMQMRVSFYEYFYFSSLFCRAPCYASVRSPCARLLLLLLRAGARIYSADPSPSVTSGSAANIEIASILGLARAPRFSCAAARRASPPDESDPFYILYSLPSLSLCRGSFYCVFTRLYFLYSWRVLCFSAPGVPRCYSADNHSTLHCRAD